MTLLRRWIGRAPPALDETDVIRTFVATLARLDQLAWLDQLARSERAEGEGGR